VGCCDKESPDTGNRQGFNDWTYVTTRLLSLNDDLQKKDLRDADYHADVISNCHGSIPREIRTFEVDGHTYAIIEIVNYIRNALWKQPDTFWCKNVT